MFWLIETKEQLREFVNEDFKEVFEKNNIKLAILRQP